MNLIKICLLSKLWISKICVDPKVVIKDTTYLQSSGVYICYN